MTRPLRAVILVHIFSDFFYKTSFFRKRRLLLYLVVCCATVFDSNKSVSAQESWEELSIPFMATIEQMVATPDGSVFAVAWKPYVGSTIFRSVDQGLSWSELNLPASFYRLAVSDDGVVFMVDATHIYRSVDNGDSWVEIGTGPSMFTTIAVSPAGVVAAGNIDWQGAFVMLSFDNGVTWKNEYILGYTEQMYLYFNNSEVLFMANENELEKSADYGESWQVITPGGSYGQPSHNALAFGTDNEIYYGMAWDNGIFKSTDNGVTWERVLNTGTQAIAVNSNGEVFAGEYRSTDGVTWTVMKEFVPAGVSKILIDNNDVIYVSSNFEIKVSTDNGQTWRTSNQGLADAEITGLVSNQEHVFLAKNGRIFHSADNGGTWNQSGMDLTGYFDDFVYEYQMESVKVSPSGEVFAFGNYANWMGEYDVVLHSKDFGETWSPFASRQLSDIAFDAGESMFMLSNLDFFRSFDNGVNWEKMTNVPDCFNPLRVVADQTGNVYVNSPICSPTVVYRTSDNGNNWIAGYLPDGAKADRLYLNSRGDVYAHKLSGGIYVSEDHGMNWRLMDTESYFQEVSVMEIDPYDNIYVSTEAGLFMSSDYGTTWIPLNLVLPAGSSVNYLSSDASGYVYASTTEGKVYRQHVRVGVETPFATEISLYPNPANDFVNLTIDGVQTISPEDIRILDMSGRLVKTFTLESRSAKIDVSNLDAGVYIVAGRYVNRKMVVR